ncbi:MAG TPA: serine/threonine-protein kinase [Pseudomonadales bacterium]|nr:serine/threonine-protein kinase [Pseudomonadales bacterium]
MLDSTNTGEFTAIDEAALGDNRAFELNGYSDIRQIGSGGMATVYSATQNSFQRTVAIKALLPAYAADVEFAKRFLREAQIVSQLSHPHIIPVYDFGQRDGTFYMVMDFMANGDLAHRIKKGLSVDETLAILSDIASALHFAHEKGFVHRDVKPDNVMFREDNSAVLTDFGIARKQSSENQMTVAGQILGTPKYMSPEQLQGREVDGRTDIYSLGIMFFEMLAKKCPYDDPDFMALAMLHIQAPIPKLPAQFAKFQKFFERMVAKQPEHRFQSGLEIVKVIQQIRSGKVDAAGVDSGNAASLKKALHVDEGNLASTESASSTTKGNVRVSREVMIELQDMDPLLNENWHAIADPIFSKMGEDEKKYVYNQFLKPKGILYDSQKNTLVFHGRKTVAEVAEQVLRNAGLQAIAAKILKTQQLLRNTRDTNVFADMVESGLSIIERYNTEDKLSVQKEKVALRNAYLDDLVTLVRQAQFDPPAGRRALTVEAVKQFIIDGYLRHQMQGYRFKTMHLSRLEADPHPYLNGLVAKEARIRQCYLIRSKNFLFMIGPVKNMGQDPYSIRRFLQEDSAMGGQALYFYAVAIDLDTVDNPAEQEATAWKISRIVTLERQLSVAIVDLVKDFEKHHRETLRPLLLKEIGADGTEIEEAIHNRLIDYERKLSMLVLGKLPKALVDQAKTIDDFEFLFFSLRNLVIELACDVRDFAAQSTSVWSDEAEAMDYRMMSYLLLLDKRKDILFVAKPPEKVDPTTDPDMLLEELKQSLNTHEHELEALNEKLAAAIKESSKTPNAFMRWIEKVTGADKKKVTPDDVRNQITATMHKCLISIIRLQKRYPKVTVYLEFEGIATINENQRHYAIANGKIGVARLPNLLILQEDRTVFDIAAVRNYLEDDLFSATWKGGHT